MLEVKTISWRELTGNKFLKSLHPAMLSNEKYVCTQRIRRVGYPSPDVFRTIYDREYAVNYLFRKICKPLSFLGREKLIQLVEEAWEINNKKSSMEYWEEES